MDKVAPLITRADLDWLCIAHRAIEQAPTNDLLYIEAVNTMRGLIVAFNRSARNDCHAAHAQYLLNKLVAHAVSPSAALTGSGVPVPLVSERVKDALMHIAAGGYDARSLL